MAEVKDWFDYHGLAVTQWATRHGFEPAHVYALLAGRTRGKRGSAHRIAVALRIKSGIAV